MANVDVATAAADLVERSRREQGLPPRVQDASTLASVAKLVGGTGPATPIRSRGAA